MKLSPRDHLVETALYLFYKDGFHATGIDRILAEAKVAKATLYKHFPSKDDLILECLSLRDRQFRAFLQDGVSLRTKDPAECLIILFDVLSEWFQEPHFHGCMFINAGAEYGEATNPIQQASRDHKAHLQHWLSKLAKAAGAKDPEALARQIALLKDGAIVSAQLGQGTAAADTARDIASRLVRDSLVAAPPSF